LLKALGPGTDISAMDRKGSTLLETEGRPPGLPSTLIEPSVNPHPPARTLRRIVAGVSLFAAGLGTGWLAGRQTPRVAEIRVVDFNASPDAIASSLATPPASPVAVPAGWAFVPLDAGSFCDVDGRMRLNERFGSGKPSAPPKRLVDELVDRSPIPPYETSGNERWIAPSEDVEIILETNGIVTGWMRGFTSSSRRGGFSQSALDFPNAGAARAAAADLASHHVCAAGLDLWSVEGQSSIVVASSPAPGSQSYAWWIHGSRVIQVGYSMWDPADVELTRMASIVKAAWELA
jgi:hypothetical protein